MSFARFSLPLFIFLSPALLLAQESKKLKYIPAVKELQKHKLAINRLRKEQAAELKLLAGKQAIELREVRNRTAKALETLQKKATLANRLDDALAIREAIKNLSKPQPATPRPKAVSMRIPKNAVAFGGHHYFVVRSKDSWHEAQAKCLAVGGHLVSIGSKEEQQLMQRILPKGDVHFWTGGTDEGTEGKWRWTDGTKWEYEQWTATIQPDGQLGYGDYVIIAGAGHWNDFHASGLWSRRQFVHGFVCEWDR